MGLTQADVDEITSNHSKTKDAVEAAIVAHGGFSWRQFHHHGVMSLDLDDPRPKCTAYLRNACKRGSAEHESALMFEFTRKKFHDPFPLPFVSQDVASFLLVRGPFAWIGFSWMGCNTAAVVEYLRPTELDVVMVSLWTSIATKLSLESSCGNGRKPACRWIAIPGMPPSQ